MAKKRNAFVTDVVVCKGEEEITGFEQLLARYPEITFNDDVEGGKVTFEVIVPDEVHDSYVTDLIANKFGSKSDRVQKSLGKDWYVRLKNALLHTVQPVAKNTMSPEQLYLRAIVKSAYDLQKLRSATGNRIAANFRSKLGAEPGVVLSDKEALKTLDELKKEYKRITDAAVVMLGESRRIRRRHDLALFSEDILEPNGLISNEVEFVLISQYMGLLRNEEDQLGPNGMIKAVLEQHPIWTEYLEGIKGIGPAMAGVLVSHIDIERAIYPSSLWALFGIGVEDDGRGTSMKSEHLITRKYISAKGDLEDKRAAKYDPWLKSKIVGVMGEVLIKQSDGKYRQIYLDYKNRLENHPNHVDKSKGHRHNMARRYMVKIFLLDLYRVWRKMEGLPVSKPYHEAKLGIVHSKNSPDAA